MDNRIFISYSSKDAKIAQKIVSFLEGNGHPCWIAPRNIDPGHDYTDCINEAIKNCCCVVLVFSEHSLASQFVKKELGLAVHFNKSIIPYKIADFKVDDGYFFLLNNVQWIEAAGKVESKFPELLTGVEAVVGKSNESGFVKDAYKTPLSSKKKTIVILSATALVVIIVLLSLIMKGGGEDNDDVISDSTAITETALTPETQSQDIVSTPIASTTESSAADQKKKNEPKSQTSPQEKTNPTTTIKEHPTASKQGQQTQTTADESDDNTESDVDPTPAGPSQYDLKLRNAKVLYSSKKYREALFLFQELKKDNPNGASLDYYISECRKMLEK